jgi:hypothetical protein
MNGPLLASFFAGIGSARWSDQQLLEMMTNVQDRGGNWCGPGSGSPGPERKEPFSVEGVGSAGADCVEGMGSSHVRESWACTEPGMPQRCGFRHHWGDCPFASLQRWGYWAPSEPPASWRSSAARIWLSHSAPSWRPFGSWSSRSQRHVAIIASTMIRQSRSRS